MKKQILSLAFAALALSATAQQSHRVIVSLPEEPPTAGDVLYVTEVRQGLATDTVEMGYYEMQGKMLDRFPNWRAADQSEGIHNRFTDMWCEIAAMGAQEGEEQGEPTDAR